MPEETRDAILGGVLFADQHVYNAAQTIAVTYLLTEVSPLARHLPNHPMSPFPPPLPPRTGLASPVADTPSCPSCILWPQFVNWEHTAAAQGGPLSNDMLNELDVFGPERNSRLSSPRDTKEDSKTMSISFEELLTVRGTRPRWQA